jgi:hypothetical protein
MGIGVRLSMASQAIPLLVGDGVSDVIIAGTIFGVARSVVVVLRGASPSEISSPVVELSIAYI